MDTVTTEVSSPLAVFRQTGQPGRAGVVAMVAFKGGVAKTTSSINLAAALTERGLRVLLIDLDPQAQVSAVLHLAAAADETGRARSVYRVLLGELPLDEIILQGPEGFAVAPAAKELALAEKNLPSEPDWAMRLRHETDEITTYDWIVIDTPPTIGVLTNVALVAADLLISPIELDYLSAKALPSLLDATSRLARDARGRPNLNPDLRILGLLPVKVDLRTVYARDFATSLETQIAPLRLLQPGVKSTVIVREATARGLSVLRYRPQSQPATAYRALAEEVLRA